MTNTNSKRGFTLIEILIVVAIIAVLASVVLVGLGPAQRNGRDTRRVKDLRDTQTGLELYYQKCGYYPGPVENGSSCTSFGSAASDWDTLSDVLTGSNLGVSAVPKESRSGVSYRYGTDTNGTSYVLGAELENASSQALQSDIDGTVYGVDCGDPADDTVYCIQY